MKKLIAISLSIILIASWGVSLAAAKIPHENPSTTKTDFDIALPSLLLYSDILNQVAERNYPETRALIQRSKPAYAHIPEEIRFVMTRYNDLITELTDSLDSLDAALEECELLISQNKLEDARPKLTQTKWLVDETTDLLEDITMATDELIRRLAPFIPPQQAEAVAETEARLRGAAERLKELDYRYRNTLETLNTAASEKEELSITKVTLDINPAEAWVGDSITASGTLKAEENRALAARDVSILLNGEYFATASTAGDGAYQVTFDMPYDYIPETTVQASYLPEGEDGKNFLASSSPIKMMATLFHFTQLEVEAPGEAYPGLPIEISGKITSEGDFANRHISGLLDNEPLFEAITDDQGLFWQREVLSSQTWVGEHELSISVAPEDKSRSAGCSINTTLTVIKATPQIKIDAPTLVVLPGTIEVNGEVYSELPMQGAILDLKIGGTSTTTTVEDGKFQAKLNLPFQFSPMGYQELQVNVAPAEPWHLPTEARMHIFAINSASLGIVLATVIPLGVVLSTRKRRAWREGKVPLISLETRELPQVIPPWKPEAKLEGTKGVIFKAYFTALEIVERVTKIHMTPQMTLREFLIKVKPDIGSAGEAFSQLTALTERASYSLYMPGEDEAAGAERLTLKVKELEQSPRFRSD